MKRRASRSPEAIQFAKTQRRMANEFARIAWSWLRNRQCCGMKFRREYPIPPYTVDFCCVERRLVIEIDGESHFTKQGQRHDRRRDRFLRQHGYRILRISGYQLLRDERAARETIQRFVQEAIENSP